MFMMYMTGQLCRCPAPRPCSCWMHASHVYVTAVACGGCWARPCTPRTVHPPQRQSCCQGHDAQLGLHLSVSAAASFTIYIHYAASAAAAVAAVALARSASTARAHSSLSLVSASSAASASHRHACFSASVVASTIVRIVLSLRDPSLFQYI